MKSTKETRGRKKEKAIFINFRVYELTQETLSNIQKTLAKELGLIASLTEIVEGAIDSLSKKDPQSIAKSLLEFEEKNNQEKIRKKYLQIKK